MSATRAFRKLSIATGFAALASILLLPVILLVLPFKVGFAVPETIEAFVLAILMVFVARAHRLQAS
ncbi:MAG: hypothetical protein WCC63_04360 [Candidatus Bathyarchaeia archaeon]